MSFAVDAGDGQARTGTLHTEHGDVATPAFMPVGTRGTVRGLDGRDLAEAGAEMLLANTYHLMLRPGADTVRALGGLHALMAWDGPTLTDSGGFQVFSLEPRIDEDGITFKSVYDGSESRLTPETAVRTQEAIGADVAMVLDHLVGLPATEEVVRDAMERTLRWSERALAVKGEQSLFGIVQGGVDPELREESARRTALLGFDGYGIGGLSVGESADERNATLEVVCAVLPENRPRYVMGLGDTAGVLDAVARGCDLFDCVWPTRLARHGKVLSRTGDYSIRLAAWARDTDPIDAECPCLACRRYARGHLRHLFIAGEMLGLRLLSIHNLTYTLSLLSGARTAIAGRGFDEYRARVLAARDAMPDHP